jgi:hypothetical protein
VAFATKTQKKIFLSPPVSNLVGLRSLPKIVRMLIFTAEGPRSVDDRDVLAVYSDHRMGGYVSATLILSSGEEVSGMVLVAALDRLERELADHLLPPEADGRAERIVPQFGRASW